MKTKQNAKEWMENGTQQNEYMCVCVLCECVRIHLAVSNNMQIIQTHIY